MSILLKQFLGISQFESFTDSSHTRLVFVNGFGTVADAVMDVIVAVRPLQVSETKDLV